LITPDWRALKAQVRIVYLDRDLVVAEKSAGLATVRYHGPDAPRVRASDEPPVLAEVLPPLIRAKEGVRARKGKPRPLRVVQRLDIGTSGLVVFARTPDAERELGNQFRKHSVQRSYVALVHGAVAAPRRIESFLIENRGDGLRGSLPGQGAGRRGRGKQAITHIKPLERIGAYTLVECRLETGRTHQIRIHLAEAGHPLCGESVYHRALFGEARADTSGAPRILLHAGELGFEHPRSKQQLRFTQPPPEDFLGFLAALRVARPIAERPAEGRRDPVRHARGTERAPASRRQRAKERDQERDRESKPPLDEVTAARPRAQAALKRASPQPALRRPASPQPATRRGRRPRRR
jgi:23S rRNA pseudouridine1911/1915/1917 synthase